MTNEHPEPARQETDKRRIDVWENEGGCLASANPPATDVADVRWMRAVALSGIPNEGAIHLELSGIPICLARSEGAVHALLDECSHGQVALSDGDVAGGFVECWLHGSCFDLATGVPTGPPAIATVPVYPVRIVGDVVEVAISTPSAPLSRPTSLDRL